MTPISIGQLIALLRGSRNESANINVGIVAYYLLHLFSLSIYVFFIKMPSLTIKIMVSVIDSLLYKSYVLNSDSI